MLSEARLKKYRKIKEGPKKLKFGASKTGVGGARAPGPPLDPHLLMDPRGRQGHAPRSGYKFFHFLAVFGHFRSWLLPLKNAVSDTEIKIIFAFFFSGWVCFRRTLARVHE